MIDDKKLEKAILREIKVGLTIYCGGEEIAFIGSEWMARTTQERLREKLRGTLGALVEMLGFIPSEGCIRVRKIKDGYSVQQEMNHVTGEQIGTFLSREAVPVKPTDLSYGWAWWLWQTEDGKLYGQSAARVDDGSTEAWINGAGCLVIRDYDTGEEQYIRVNRPSDDVGRVKSELWAHLERVMWTSWDTPAEMDPEDPLSQRDALTAPPEGEPGIEGPMEIEENEPEDG